jgi:signal transduction histidine kinase
MDGQHTLPEQFEVAPAAQEAIDLLHQVAADKQIEVVNALDPNQQAFADPEQIRLILRNLLNNALKFTPEGGKVLFAQANPSPEWLQVRVSDTGIGMSAETQTHLFDQSTQSTRGTANEKGTGLGLLLCKDFVEKNGGRIWVESQPEQGSTFYFTLPVSANPENSI